MGCIMRCLFFTYETNSKTFELSPFDVEHMPDYKNASVTVGTSENDEVVVRIHNKQGKLKESKLIDHMTTTGELVQEIKIGDRVIERVVEISGQQPPPYIGNNINVRDNNTARSVAISCIKKGETNNLFLHPDTTETYYILKGEATIEYSSNGKVDYNVTTVTTKPYHVVGDNKNTYRKLVVPSGKYITVYNGTTQRITNSGDTDLQILVICCPPWQKSDHLEGYLIREHIEQAGRRSSSLCKLV